MQTESGKSTITVIKPFVFTQPPPDGHKIPVERKFMPDRDARGRFVPTDFEVEDFIADHPYISEQYADGAIESPQQREARQAVIDEQARKIKEQDEKANAEAAKAMERATGAAQRAGERNSALTTELDTPVNEAAIAAGEGLAVPAATDPAALEEELNTPLSVLRQRQAAAAKKKAK